MATITGIYCIQHSTSGKMYVGQAVDVKRRWAAHKRRSKKGASAIADAIKVFGADAFDFTILEECDRAVLNEREVFWIAELAAMVPTGYNLTSGGNAPLEVSLETRQRQAAAQRGKVHPREVVEKRRQAVLGQKRSAETRAKMRASQSGKKASPETIEKLRQSHLGQAPWNAGVPMRAEAKAKMSASKTGVPAIHRRKPVMRSDGRNFDSIQQAADDLGAHRTTILKHLAGKLMTVHGYTFSRGGASLPQ